MAKRAYEKSVQEALSPKVYSFECEQCGKCCRGTVMDVLPIEALRLNALAKKHNKKLLMVNFTFDTGVPMVKIMCSPCPFYEGGKCIIYDERPTICRAYPIRPHPSKVILDFGCPWVLGCGMDSGKFDGLPLNGMAAEIKEARKFAQYVMSGINYKQQRGN